MKKAGKKFDERELNKHFEGLEKEQEEFGKKIKRFQSEKSEG